MGDSGRYLGYDEDVARWNLQDEVEMLRKENEQLKQQLADIQRHPIGTLRSPIYWCWRCGNPVAGRAMDHVSNGGCE